MLQEIIQGLVDLGDLVSNGGGSGIATLSEIIKKNFEQCCRLDFSLDCEIKQRIAVYCAQRVEANLDLIKESVDIKVLERAFRDTCDYMEILRWLDLPTRPTTLH